MAKGTNKLLRQAKEREEITELETQLEDANNEVAKYEFSMLPSYKKLAIYFTKGLGILLGILLILALLGVGS